uniref:DENN domain-containing protein 1C-like n=1 Tax=Macaca mulatta TaxID=9544 RepID=UPI0010A288B0|nr:DENN domain-containing protein 1C-like [Macaca mulatta]
MRNCQRSFSPCPACRPAVSAKYLICGCYKLLLKESQVLAVLEADQEVISPSQSSIAPADPSSGGDPEHSPLTESLILYPSPPYKAAKDSRAQVSPSSRLSTVPTQPSPPESPQIPAPTKSNFDIAQTAQPLDPSPDSSSPENPRSQPPKVLLVEHTHLQSLEELGGLNSVTHKQPARAPGQEPAPRVADLKCFDS